MPSKHHSMVFYSSTMEVALCKEKKTSLKTPLQWQVHITDIYEWSMSSSLIVNLTVNLPFITCKQLISISFKTSVSPLSKKSISHENLSIKDISYQQQVFSLQVFHIIRFSSHFFVTFESIEYFNHYNMMTSPILTL